MGVECTYDGFGGSADPDTDANTRVCKQYFLTFYRITSTVTTSGVFGDMYSKNYLEIMFTVVMLLVNLKIVNYGRTGLFKCVER